VCVAVVTCNSERYIRRCLEGILEQEGVATEIVVVDNASSDGTRAVLRRFKNRIRTIYNDRNLGFAEAQKEYAAMNPAGAGVALNRALYEHGIATLIGLPASTFSMPVKVLATAVPAIPVGIPSQLLERRPDIAAAERAMAEANAVIGGKEAAYYPSLSLTGSGGYQSSTLASLISAPALFWSLGAAASETLFDGGLRKATVAQYTASYDGSVAAYKQAVLTGMQQVEDQLSTLRILSSQIVQQDKAVVAAQRYLDLATARYQTGLDPYLAVLTAQGILLGDQQTLMTLRVSEMTAAVRLIQALGGGWRSAR